jgi:flagellar biosynthesis chaperone FliJ
MTAKQKLPPEREMVREEERQKVALPFKEYGRDRKKIEHQIQKLEKEYDEREKVIEQIMEYGTGIETEKALRMYTTAVLRKWEKSLQSFQKAKHAK